MNRTREQTQTEFTGNGFGLSSLFTSRGLCSVPVMSNDMLSKYTRKKFSFSKNVMSKLKVKSIRKWSKVQLVAAILWDAFISVDKKKYNNLRDSVVIQSINPREKMASLIPKDSCGNIVALFATEAASGVAETTPEALTDLLSDCVRKTISNYSKAYHNTEEGKTMVFDSYSQLFKIDPESTNVVVLISWCKFCFCEADFGFGKPIWVAPGTIPGKNSAYLMDDAEGNGVEAYVFLETKDLPYFEEALDRVINTFSA